MYATVLKHVKSIKYFVWNTYFLLSERAMKNEPKET